MRAQRQGDLDALCGLYALVNAMEMTGIVGPKSAFHRKLFARLIRSLPEPLLRDALTIGLDQCELLMAGLSAFRWIDRRYGVRLKIAPIKVDWGEDDVQGFRRAVSHLIADRRTAVIINVIAPGMDHWTVVNRIEREEIVVRDSGRLRLLPSNRFSLAQGPYRLEAERTIVLRRVGGATQLRAIDLGRPPSRRQQPRRSSPTSM